MPSKREFHDSIRVITDRLAEIPQELEAHEVVLKEEVSVMGEKVMSVMGDKIQESNGKLMAEIGLLLSGVLPYCAINQIYKLIRTYNACKHTHPALLCNKSNL